MTEGEDYEEEDYEEHDYDAERGYEREVVYEENGGNGTGRWYGDGMLKDRTSGSMQAT